MKSVKYSWITFNCKEIDGKGLGAQPDYKLRAEMVPILSSRTHEIWSVKLAHEEETPEAPKPASEQPSGMNERNYATPEATFGDPLRSQERSHTRKLRTSRPYGSACQRVTKF